jgi:hypothetical protein
MRKREKRRKKRKKKKKKKRKRKIFILLFVFFLKKIKKINGRESFLKLNSLPFIFLRNSRVFSKTELSAIYFFLHKNKKTKKTKNTKKNKGFLI